MARRRAIRPEAKPIRLFAAVDVPPSHHGAIADAVASCRDRLRGGRWDPPEKWHVTLKFMGRTWPRLVPAVEEACAAVASSVAPFEVRLGGLGVFPGPRRARVLWVGLEDPDEGTARLATGLEDHLRGEFPPERRPFTAHLTVARFREPARVEPEALATARVDAPAFTVDRLVLYRSHLLGPRGSRYEVVGRYPLGG